MKILMLVNWKVLSCKETPNDKQPPGRRRALLVLQIF